MAESATFALKAGVWFRRGRLLMVSPDSRGIACPPSGRNSTYRPVQISETGSLANSRKPMRLPSEGRGREFESRRVRQLIQSFSDLICWPEVLQQSHGNR